LAKLAINFKNAGYGGLFNVFDVPQMENGWKMEDGTWKTDSSTLVGCYEAVARFAKWPFRLVGLIQRFLQAD
jgi:hypothetical protein